MGTCKKVTVFRTNMRIVIWILVVCLAVAVVEGQKGKGKGKGKPSKGKGKPTKPSKPGKPGNEEPTGTGGNEEGGKGGKGKGKGKGNGNLENQCAEGKRPCMCEELDRAKKPKGKGKPTKPSKGKGKGKGKPTNSENPEEPETEICCCEEGEGGEGPGGNKPEPRGFCIDEEKVVGICMAGSAVVEKAIPAWESCADQCEGYMRSSVGLPDMRAKKPKGKGGKGKPSKPSKGKGKGKKPSKGKGNCPTVSQIKEKTKEKFACEICHFTAMGWIDDEMVADETIIQEDIETLPSEISEALMGEEYEECMSKFEEKERAKEKCSYTEEEKTELEEVFRGVAHTQCFKAVFEIGCGTFMENTIHDMIYGSGSGSGSGSEVDVVISG